MKAKKQKKRSQNDLSSQAITMVSQDVVEDSLRILPMYGDKRFAQANSGTLIVVAAPEEVFIINIRMK